MFEQAYVYVLRMRKFCQLDYLVLVCVRKDKLHSCLFGGKVGRYAGAFAGCATVFGIYNAVIVPVFAGA